MKIGRVVRILEDTSRKDIFSKIDENRKVIISIFYPMDENYKIEKQAFYKDLYDPRQDAVSYTHLDVYKRQLQ